MRKKKLKHKTIVKVLGSIATSQETNTRKSPETFYSVIPQVFFVGKNSVLGELQGKTEVETFKQTSLTAKAENPTETISETCLCGAGKLLEKKNFIFLIIY
jgi:hypothetical protein